MCIGANRLQTYLSSFTTMKRAHTRSCHSYTPKKKRERYDENIQKTFLYNAQHIYTQVLFLYKEFSLKFRKLLVLLLLKMPWMLDLLAAAVLDMLKNDKWTLGIRMFSAYKDMEICTREAAGRTHIPIRVGGRNRNLKNTLHHR